MNLFDKICAVPVIILGILFMIAGVIGLFDGLFLNPSFWSMIQSIFVFCIGWTMTIVLIRFWDLLERLKPKDVSYNAEDYNRPDPSTVPLEDVPSVRSSPPGDEFKAGSSEHNVQSKATYALNLHLLGNLCDPEQKL